MINITNKEQGKKRINYLFHCKIWHEKEKNKERERNKEKIRQIGMDHTKN